MSDPSAVGQGVWSAASGSVGAGTAAVSSGSYGAPTAAPPQNDGAARQYIAENYPGMLGWINDPELGPILMNAGYHTWAPAKLDAVVQGTSWYRNLSESERKYENTQKSDPTTLASLIDEKRTELHSMALNMGLTDLDVAPIAEQAVKYGWTAQQIKEMVASHIDMSTTRTAGQTQAMFSFTKQQASDYFVKADDGQNLEFARRIAAGDMQPADVKAYYQAQAKQNNPYLANALDQGVTMKQYFAPHQAEIAKVLEVAPDSIDFMNNSKYGDVMRVHDDASGKLRPMTMTEVGDWARKQPEWNHTQNAQAAGANVASQLAQAFGAADFGGM